MARKEITVIIDRVGNTIDVWFGKPTKAVCAEVEEEFLVKKDLKTGEVVGFELFNAFLPGQEIPPVKVFTKIPETEILA